MIDVSMPAMRIRHHWVLMLGLLSAIGCGSSFPSTAPVSGVVTFDGAPVDGATIIFGRGTRDANKGELAVGKTDANGRFELTTHFGSQASAKGAVPGAYEVTISKHIPPPGLTLAQYQAMVEAANKVGESGGMLPADKQPPPMVEMFAPKYSVAGKSELKATVTASGATDLKFAVK